MGVIYLLFPESSYAWGPGVHIKLGLDVMENIAKIAPAICDIIIKYPHHFLYGSISPDIIIGKKYAKEIDHCHNWEVGRTILKSSRSDAETSFGYGYLSHLAADTIAHNYFVPNQIISNFAAKTLRHAYWEMRYDGLLEEGIWEVFKEIPKEIRRESNKRLKNILTTTLFSFFTNKRIFNGVMHINRISKWREMIRAISNKSQWTLSKKDVENYYRITLDSQSDILKNNEMALCMKADPNGKDTLKTARKVRKDLSILYRRGSLSDDDCEKIITELKPHLIKKTTTREKASHTIRIKSRKNMP
jgi:hypothetical protein